MTEFTELSGLDYLEGMTVRVVSDGALNGDYVVANGRVKLDTPAVTGWVGLVYNGRLVSLPNNGGHQGAKVIHARKRFDNVAIQYQASVGGWIGPPDRADQFYQFAVRETRDDISTAVPGRNDVSTKQFSSGWGSNQIEIRPTPGFPMKILKIEGRLTSND